MEGASLEDADESCAATRSATALLRFSPLPFTGLFPILFLSVSSSYPLITIYRLLVRSNAQYAYLYAARLLMHSSLTHAQPYCTVYKDSMDILFL